MKQVYLIMTDARYILCYERSLEICVEPIRRCTVYKENYTFCKLLPEIILFQC